MMGYQLSPSIQAKAPDPMQLNSAQLTEINEHTSFSNFPYKDE